MASTHHQYLNETLICHMYLGCSPLFLTIVISLHMLSTFCQQQHICPCFSIQALAQTLCHLHAVPYWHHLMMQLRIAYDAYLEILNGVNKKLNHTLNHDQPDCLKCWNPTSYGAVLQDNSCVAWSDFWLHAADVNKFTYSARLRARIITILWNATLGDDWIDEDTNAGGASCVNQWWNAGPEQRKKMFAMFDESGIFLARCDMVQSGKLAKYPLAVLEHLLAVYGWNGAVFYDIGCRNGNGLTKQ
ncbi:hypothetical protein BKA83DRAFT_4463356 [Pisolithus microcarpus]|nr:hypothetical protein BKA83DRAFT_4463356 [Pisolithus microcarpus]